MFSYTVFSGMGTTVLKGEKKNCKLKKRKEKSHFQSIGKKTNFWDLFKGVKKKSKQNNIFDAGKYGIPMC